MIGKGDILIDILIDSLINSLIRKWVIFQWHN